MHLVFDVKPTNSPSEILKLYQEHSAKSGIQSSGHEVSEAVAEFFKPVNCYKRLCLHRDFVNKSQLKRGTPLKIYYLNLTEEERLVNLLQIASKAEAFELIDKQVKLEKDQEEKAKAEKQKVAEEKKKKYLEMIKKEVFGDSLAKLDKKKTVKEIFDGLAEPKDKWKLGKLLKELQAKFPHDRVLQRMVQFEFQDT